MSIEKPNFELNAGSRREFLRANGLGVGGVALAWLLNEQGLLAKPVKPDLVGFEIPNEYVVGYGLQYMNRYRNLPSVAVLEPDDMAKESPA